ncbi:hypothetical protein V8G54_000529, partial [Vigna mungo]
MKKCQILRSLSSYSQELSDKPLSCTCWNRLQDPLGPPTSTSSLWLQKSCSASSSWTLTSTRLSSLNTSSHHVPRHPLPQPLSLHYYDCHHLHPPPKRPQYPLPRPLPPHKYHCQPLHPPPKQPHQTLPQPLPPHNYHSHPLH